MAEPRNTLTRADLPTKQAHRFGLRSVAAVESQANGHWMFGADWLESCGTNVLVAPNNCDPLVEPEDRVKTSFALEDGVGTDDFTLYGFHRCSVVGDPIGERWDYAKDELDLGEWFQAERRLMERILSLGTTPYAPGVSGAINALGALLQQWQKPMEPIVHVTPNVAVALGDRLKQVDGHLELTTGEKVSVGYGYVTGLADATEGYIALTGPVFGIVGSDSNLGGETVDRETNTYLALVERPFSLGYLCDAIHVQVNDVVTTTA